MQFDSLSDDAKESAVEMIRYCLNQGFCMGMDEGYDLETDEPLPLRAELEEFTDSN